MEKTQIIIIEDEFIVAEDIRQTLLQEGNHVAGCFESAEEALEKLPSIIPDLALVDIRLSGVMTGIDFVEKLKEQTDIPVIYITAEQNDKTYQLARATRPSAFLVKPFNTPTLLASIDLAYYNYANNKTPDDPSSQEIPDITDLNFPAIIHNSIFIRKNGKHVKVSIDDILFIEADGSYCKIVTATQMHTLTHNLSDFKRRVNLPQLLQVHRSYIVNLTNIDSFDENTIYIRQYKIQVSKTFRPDLIARINVL